VVAAHFVPMEPILACEGEVPPVGDRQAPGMEDLRTVGDGRRSLRVSHLGPGARGPAYLPVSTRGFVTAWVMHCLAMKLGTVIRRGLTTGWKLAMVTLAIVEMMIDVSVEMI
jgi:hypothetical protein